VKHNHEAHNQLSLEVTHQSLESQRGGDQLYMMAGVLPQAAPPVSHTLLLLTHQNKGVSQIHTVNVAGQPFIQF
jgi:hypothetical protein